MFDTVPETGLKLAAPGLVIAPVSNARASDRDWMPTTQSIERVSGQSQERTKSANLTRLREQRLRKLAYVV